MSTFASPSTTARLSAPPPNEIEVQHHLYGAAKTLYRSESREVVISGPAGTGKSYGCILKQHLKCYEYDGVAALMVRKTLNSLTASGVQTYKRHVLNAAEPVVFHGGSLSEPPAFRYLNTGSRLYLGGMDNVAKVMSREYDLIYVQEATELSEDDWEALTTRLRNGAMPFQQLIADCNPAAPSHWLKRRADTGQTVMLHSRHEDNPRLYQHGEWTEEGQRYKAVLDALTGVRRLRLRDGIWAAAEGLVYDSYELATHIIERASLPQMRRVVIGADWGYSAAGVLSAYGIDGDGRAYLLCELYCTQRTIDWWINAARELNAEYHPEAFVCDPAEPGFIRQFQDAGLPAIPARNDIRLGIQLVQQRLKRAGDGRPRLSFLREANRQPDKSLQEAGKPWGILQELESYVWAKGRDGVTKELPVDESNHALDCLRYVCHYLDGQSAVELTWA